jgi:hypothetical protein
MHTGIDHAPMIRVRRMIPIRIPIPISMALASGLVVVEVVTLRLPSAWVVVRVQLPGLLRLVTVLCPSA